MSRFPLPFAPFLGLLAGLLLLQAACAGNVPYVATPPIVVEEMLKLAKVRPGDVVYDLGSGDGRIVITAARDFGARGVGIDIDPRRIEEARENARDAGVAQRVEFRQEDLFAARIGEATVVTLYLLTSVNARLRPKLLGELRPGTRIVSHDFGIAGWEPADAVRVGNSTLYYFVVP